MKPFIKLPNILIAISLLLALTASPFGVTPAYAASFSVATAAELIAAINTANSNNANDTITLTADITLTAVDNPFFGDNGLPVILADGGNSLTIEGGGFTIARDGAAPDFRIFFIGTNANVTMNDLTISNGSSSSNGGGIYNNRSALTLTNSTFTGNSVNGDFIQGGGIYNLYGTLTVTNSTFTGNSTSGSGGNGGGISTVYGTLTVTSSTFTGNSANSVPGGVSSNGGGIYSIFSTLTVTNSTFTGNSVNGPSLSSAGGGIYNVGTLTVTSSTFTGNSSSIGGGIYTQSTSGSCADSSTVTVANSTFSGNSASFRGGGIANWSGVMTLLFNTITANTSGGGVVSFNNDSACIKAGSNIIFGNTGSDVSAIFSTQRFSSLGYNLVGVAGSNVDFTQEFNQTGDLTGAAYDPNLGPLANNGGPTQTHALLAGSPAIDTGTNTGCPATDQRGIIRPQGAGCDIGAYEVDTYPTVISTSLQPNYTTGPASFTVTFSENVSNAGGGAGANDAENPANYILVEEGSAAGFQTTACNNTDFVQDTQILVNSVNYSPNTATVNLSVTPPYGSYRLFVCGTTSITNIAGNELNNGVSDYTFDFTVAPVAAASSLPDTGFAPNRITSLPAQTTQYAALGSIWLEIPSLGVKSEIVGVPQSANGWNVDWLGQSAGWLHGTAFPSWEGNSVITGHVYDANGLPGPFQKLNTLKHGEQVIVHMFGEKYIFEVRDSNMVFPSNTKSALEHLEDHSYLTLITCQGYNLFNDSYIFRRVVRAVLVNVQAE